MIVNAIEMFSSFTKREFLRNELNQIEYYLIYKDSYNAKVSKVSVAWHLNHCLEVINEISKALLTSNPERYTDKLSMRHIFSLFIGYIPRGKIVHYTSPHQKTSMKIKDLVAKLIRARDVIEEIESLEERLNYIHPVYGGLNKRQSRRFIEVHTKHHLKIIRDILSK